ncbi:hypothetical protein ACFFUP_10135 [Vibrio ostreicida]|uniref:Uncharacterized protein n=1 Tax=Vibrio ostreicida TaxID=526588 RepID=A0ABT8C0I3_9VIBR|nr:hypothetical protein [Vibrio ostreicida]MDN3612582.1 hypothetical protein [Vibrio ostreicida]NPD09202.1 hypothetical protein [Vibrio ostreicida]
MDTRVAMCIGIVLSLLYDVFQIYMSWDNKLLLLVGGGSLCAALYGLQQNLSSEEEFQLEWLKFYTIPMAILVLGQASLLDDLYVRGFAMAGIISEKVMPGETLDYLLSLEALLFSYALPFVTIIMYWLALLFCRLVNLLEQAIEKVLEL